MKYFKYRNINKIQNLVVKERLASLGKDEQKKIIRKRRFTKILSICGFVFFIACFAMFIFFIKLIPVPTHFFLKILRGIGCVLLGMLGLIVSMVSTLFTFGFLISKVEYNLPQMRKEFIAKSCEPIRIYYGLTDEYLITKCFNSTNTLFNNHDICIFRYGNDLRLTTDIVKGFINGHCDLGCYSVKFDELNIYKDDYNGKRSTILEFGNVKFIIGIKAYPYIKKLMDTKVYKYLYKNVEINDEAIYFRKHKKSNKIYFIDIDKIELSIPKYTAIPGSGYDYTYTFNVFCKNSKITTFTIVLDREEEKEIIEYFKNKNIIIDIIYFDNKYEGGD